MGLTLLQRARRVIASTIRKEGDVKVGMADLVESLAASNVTMAYAIMAVLRQRELIDSEGFLDKEKAAAWLEETKK